MMSAYRNEIEAQPASLRKLVERCRAEGLLREAACPNYPVFTGMGASYHAALTAAARLQRLGLPAWAVQASDLLGDARVFLSEPYEIIYISQSGASGEVLPLLSLMSGRKIFLAVTNDPHSPLAKNARFTLALGVERETLVATQTYLNSVAALWLLTRRWGEGSGDRDLDRLLRVADQIEALLQNGEAIARLWLEELGASATRVFTGYGVHSFTARQAAQSVSEWAKAPILVADGGAIRHGLIEIVGRDTGCVVFASPGWGRSPALRLAGDLHRFGAHVLVVDNGQTHRAAERSITERDDDDDGLAPLLDIQPAYLFSEALANHLGAPPGFRYLQKIVDRI